MTALFANNYPNFVYKIITLDNRRMYLPKTLIPKIYTLRSNDIPMKEFLPTMEEQKNSISLFSQQLLIMEKWMIKQMIRKKQL
jgi:hypothetical protein